jgi:hypothetical protein
MSSSRTIELVTVELELRLDTCQVVDAQNQLRGNAANLPIFIVTKTKNVI